MPKQIPISKIVNAVHDGYIESQKCYREWSGGYWLWSAPEYLITVNVAKKISDIEGPKFITIENKSCSAIEDAGARGAGRLCHDIRENGRIDILVWWGNDTPRGIIEIKNQIFSNEQYEKDIKRIKGFLNRKSENSSIQFGIFSFYDSAESGKKSAFHKIEDKIKKVTSNSREILGGEFTVKLFKTEIFEEVKDNAWAAACLLIMRKKITLPAGNAIRNSISK